jgi:hypothetical protein
MIKAILPQSGTSRTPVQRNTFYEVLADSHQPTADAADPPSGKSKVLEDSLAAA